MADIKLIAFDLDGTLLNDRKELTEENRCWRRRTEAFIWFRQRDGF